MLRLSAMGRGDALSHPHMAVAAMTKGDVHVLERLENNDRRKAKITRKLIKKLYRKRGEASRTVVQSPNVHSLSFASATPLICHEDTIQAQRRLSRARDRNDKRAFFVGELSRSFEEPTCLVIAPRTEQSTEQLAACAVTKDPNTNFKTSSAKVCVLKQFGHTPLSLGNKKGDAIYIHKLHMQNGLTAFYTNVLSEGDAGASPPYSLGIDYQTFRELQNLLAHMLQLELCAHS